MKLSVEHIQGFWNYLKQEEKSEATIQKYLRDVRKFRAYAQDREITKALVICWKKELEEGGYAVRSINSMLASLNSLLEFLDCRDCKVKALRQQKQVYSPEEKELSKGDYLRLLEASARKPQLRLVMQTICGTGIRVSELRQIGRASCRERV